MQYEELSVSEPAKQPVTLDLRFTGIANLNYFQLISFRDQFNSLRIETRIEPRGPLDTYYDMSRDDYRRNEETELTTRNDQPPAALLPALAPAVVERRRPLLSE